MNNKEFEFQIALTYLKAGRRIRRLTWPAWLKFQTSDNKIYVIDMDTANVEVWQPTQRDLLATDWVVEGE